MARRKAVDTESEAESGQTESDIIRPGDKMDKTKPIYIVNVTNKDKVFDDGDKVMRLTCPGTPGSVQVLTENVLRTPGFASMHSRGAVMLTYSADMRNVAVSNAELEDSKDDERIAKLKASVETTDASVSDASDKLADLKQED